MDLLQIGSQILFSQLGSSLESEPMGDVLGGLISDGNWMNHCTTSSGSF